jgi:hypothetical protein
VAVHGFHTVLKRELARLRVKEGERIAINYFGKSDRGYESYRVLTERPVQGAINWSEHQASAKAELSSPEMLDERGKPELDEAGEEVG